MPTTAKTKVGKDLQQRLWTKREYYLLKKLRDLGVNVPAILCIPTMLFLWNI